jgi:drug/metabolite transporter (DMT)-like permease
VVLFFSVLIFGQPLDGYAGMAWLNFVAAGLFSQVAGYLAINYALGYLPASIVAPTMLGQPVLTALLAWPLLGEALGGWQAFSGLVVLTGIYLVHRSR